MLSHDFQEYTINCLRRKGTDRTNPCYDLVEIVTNFVNNAFTREGIMIGVTKVKNVTFLQLPCLGWSFHYLQHNPVPHYCCNQCPSKEHQWNLDLATQFCGKQIHLLCLCRHSIVWFQDIFFEKRGFSDQSLDLFIEDDELSQRIMENISNFNWNDYF